MPLNGHIQDNKLHFSLQLVKTKLDKQVTKIFMIYCVLKSIKIVMVKFLISKNFQKHFLDSNLHIKYLIQADLKFSKIN